MTATELRNFWKKLLVEKNGDPVALRLYDYWPLADLTAKERLIKRRDVKELIAQRRDRAWYLNEIQKGNKPILCSQCKRHHFADKACYSYRFGKPGAHDLVFSHTPTTLQIRAVPTTVDLQKLRHEQEGLDVTSLFYIINFYHYWATLVVVD